MATTVHNGLYGCTRVVGVDGRRQVHWSNQLQDGAYRLFAARHGEGTAQWAKPVPLQVRAMALADKVLFVAGLCGDADDGLQGRDESRGGAAHGHLDL